MSRSGSKDTGVLGSLPVTRGALAGVGAFVVGYVLTYLIKSGDIEDKTPDDGIMTYNLDGEETDMLFSEAKVEPPEVAEVVSWLFYEMHNVDMAGTLTYTVTRDGESNSQEYDLLLGVDVETYMMLIPPLLLAAAGYWVVSSISVADETEAAKAGATVTAGYLVTAVLGALIFAYNDLNTETSEGYYGEAEQTLQLAYSVDLQSAAIMAGIIYPLAFGALGGYVAFRRESTAGPAPGRQGPPHEPQQGTRQETTAVNPGGSTDRTRNTRGDTRSVGRQGNQRSGQQGGTQRQQSKQARDARSGQSGDDSGRP